MVNAETPIQREQLTSASAVHELIRKDIVDLQLAPGQKLKLEELKDNYGFGLAPLREALSRLSAEGLVDFVDQKGFTVSKLTAEDLRDVILLRQHMECWALELSIQQGNDDWEGALVSAYYQLSKLPMRRQRDSNTFSSEWEIRHRNFHHALVGACGSPRLLTIRNLLYDQSDRYRRIAAYNVSADRDIPAEHQAIFEATIARDIESATRLMKLHLGRTAEIAISAIDKISFRDKNSGEMQ
jgi:GntR family transcriptional regulator, carbon starvation induced regulator